MPTDLTDDQQAVYDRQLRVWGVEVQKRLNEARLLIVNCTGLAAEVAKNIVLAGVGSVALQHDPSQPRPTTNFLVGTANDIASAMASELQEMNPLVQVYAEQDTPTDPYHAALLVVSATTDVRGAVAWATAMRAKGARVFVAACRGTVSWFFQDLGDVHSFTATDKAHAGLGVQQMAFASMEAAIQAAGGVATSGRSLKRTHPMLFVLHVLHAFQIKHNQAAGEKDVPALHAELQTLLKDAPQTLLTRAQQLLQEYVTATEELPAVNAVLGGLLANELIKAVGGKGEPLRNFILYSLDDGHACVECCMKQD